VPLDFVILKMEKDTCTPIILGRPFLATIGYRINVKNDKLSFDLDDEHVEFNLSKAYRFPSISGEYHRIDVVDNLVQKKLFLIMIHDPLEHCLLNDWYYSR